MIDKQNIIDAWKKIPVALESLSIVHFDHLRNLGLQQNISIDPTLFDMKSLVPKIQKSDAVEKARVIKTGVSNGESMSWGGAKRYLSALLMESIESLERSIFWFFNYRLNNKQGFTAPALQAEYYSEFFALIGISRILGIAVTHVPIFGPVLTEVNWKTKRVHYRPITVRSAHVAHLQHLGRSIDKFSFVPDHIKIRLDEFRPDANKEFKDDDEIISKFLLTDERETYVYEFSVSSRVYSDIVGGAQNFCFLGGEHGKGVIEPYSDTDSYEHARAVHDAYADYGYPEDNIGEAMKFIIMLLKEIDRRDVQRSLSWIRTKIDNFPFAKDFEKADILDWLA
jgi:hypothetical protein